MPRTNEHYVVNWIIILTSHPLLWLAVDIQACHCPGSWVGVVPWHVPSIPPRFLLRHNIVWLQRLIARCLVIALSGPMLPAVEVILGEFSVIPLPDFLRDFRFLLLFFLSQLVGPQRAAISLLCGTMVNSEQSPRHCQRLHCSTSPENIECRCTALHPEAVT